MRAEKISSLYHKPSEDTSVSMVGFNFLFYEPEFGIIKLFCLLAKHIQAGGSKTIWNICFRRPEEYFDVTLLLSCHYFLVLVGFISQHYGS